LTNPRASRTIRDPDPGGVRRGRTLGTIVTALRPDQRFARDLADVAWSDDLRVPQGIQAGGRRR